MEKNCVIKAPFLMDILRAHNEQDELALRGTPEDKSPLYAPGREGVIDFARMPQVTQSVGVMKHPRFLPVPPHRHNYIEMMFVCSGKVVHEIDGRQVVMQPGDLLLMNQYTTHSVHTCGEDDIAVNFIIQPRFFDDTYELSAKRNVLSDFIVDILRNNVNCNQYLHFTAGNHLPVNNLVEIMLCNFFRHDDDISPRRNENEADINQHLMFLLLFYLSKDLSNLSQQSSYGYERMLLETVEKYIHEQYQTATLRELAEILNQTESGLSRQIKSVFGATFKELLQAKRFERAIIILKETNLSVSDIALAVGYENSSYFYRRFRDIYQMSPREFREKFRKTGHF